MSLKPHPELDALRRASREHQLAKANEHNAAVEFPSPWVFHRSLTSSTATDGSGTEEALVFAMRVIARCAELDSGAPAREALERWWLA